jgi:2'-5' RNA ligase
MRMFVAVVPPDPAVEDLEEFLAPRREAAPFRWSTPEQWHLTLAFAADVPDRAYDEAVDRLAQAAGKRHRVTLRVAGGGAFPNAARARVLFAGLEPAAEPAAEADPADPATATAELDRLAAGTRNALSTAGAQVDGQRFRPHLTLARLGRPVETSSWVRLLDTYRGPEWTVEEIALVASHLGEGPRKRPRHEVLETFSLGPAGSGPGRPDAPPRGR